VGIWAKSLLSLLWLWLGNAHIFRNLDASSEICRDLWQPQKEIESHGWGMRMEWKWNGKIDKDMWNGEW
jgi:hypothetical protein